MRSSLVLTVIPLLLCSCGGAMRVVAFIEDLPVVQKILRHIGQWEEDERPAPRTHDPPVRQAEVVEPFYDDFPLGVPEDDAIPVLVTA